MPVHLLYSLWMALQHVKPFVVAVTCVCWSTCVATLELCVCGGGGDRSDDRETVVFCISGLWVLDCGLWQQTETALRVYIMANQAIVLKFLQGGEERLGVCLHLDTASSSTRKGEADYMQKYTLSCRSFCMRRRA